MADAESLLRDAPGDGLAELRPQVLEFKTEALRIERLVDASAAFLRVAFPMTGGGSPFTAQGAISEWNGTRHISRRTRLGGQGQADVEYSCISGKLSKRARSHTASDGVTRIRSTKTLRLPATHRNNSILRRCRLTWLRERPAGLRPMASSIPASAYVDSAVQSQMQTLGLYTAQNQGRALQSFFDVSGTTGVSAALSNLYSSFSAWSTTPTDPVAQQSVISAAGSVASSIQGLSNSLTQTSQQLGQQVDSTVSEINNLASQIQQYNVADLRILSRIQERMRSWRQISKAYRSW